MTVFRTGALGLLLVVTTSADTSHGDTIAASTASNFGVPLLFWSFGWSFCKIKNKVRKKKSGKEEEKETGRERTAPEKHRKENRKEKGRENKKKTNENKDIIKQIHSFHLKDIYWLFVCFITSFLRICQGNRTYNFRTHTKYSIRI